uniref:Uncharacterized protein n=1 Tax=Daphnia galeata TaxID=27404 RepID=A0A8J2WEN8_9CRUS|nr:unnamed protein product [Daphnia galeata]
MRLRKGLGRKSVNLDEESEIDERSLGGEFCDRSRTPRTCFRYSRTSRKIIVESKWPSTDARSLSVKDHIAIVTSTITAGGGDLNQDLVVFDSEGDSEMQHLADEVVEWGTELIETDTFPC